MIYQPDRATQNVALKDALLKWLEHPDLNTFITVSLKQAYSPFDERECIREMCAQVSSRRRHALTHASWRPITTADVRKTGWLIRDRFTKAVFGARSNRYRPFLVFAEGDGAIKRRHLHIVSVRPLEMTPAEYERLFRAKTADLDWVHDQVDFRAIETGTDGKVRSYCLKEGLDAFVPEASFVPPPL